MSQHFDNDDLNILSSFFSAIGDSIGVIIAQRAAIEAAEKARKEASDKIEESYKKTNDKSQIKR